MGGRLGAESKDGRGSTFPFTVRLGVGVATPATGLSAPASVATSARPLRGLFAEDNPVNQGLITGLRAKQGHRVVVVDNGAAARQAVRATAFDLGVMDVQMPERSGAAAPAARRE